MREHPQLRLRVIQAPAAARAAILAAYAKHPSVQRAEVAHRVAKAGSPNDPLYAQQWALPKISWDQAYGVVSIPGAAKIAVLDTGVDATHPDLFGRMSPGQSFVGGPPETDPNGHGTALAGIAAASVDNATGIAGVAYAGASISSVQVLQADGTGWDSDVVAGVLWAADNDAKVILMGFSSPDFSASLQDAVNYAWSKGAVLVAATGNDGSAGPSYPAGMANVIGVAATDQNDTVTVSSRTASATVAAPGVAIYATFPGNAYGNIAGTSASAAETAGLAALLVANGKSNAAASNQIRGTTDPIVGRSFGRINVLRALTTPAAPTLPPPGPTPTPTPPASPPTYLVGANNTKTTLTCDPSTVVQGTETSCTATVEDTSNSPTTPTGSVGWTHTNTGSFNGGGDTAACPLVAVDSTTASCSMTYTPEASGDHKITAEYTPDSTTHKSSKDTFTVTVAANSAKFVDFAGRVDDPLRQ